MHINKIVFLSFLFFSNLSYSDNNNQQQFKNNIEVYFFSVDFNVKKTVPKFLKKNKIEGLSILNDEKLKVSNKFKIKVMPTTVVINKNFEEVAQVKGYVDWLSPEYINFIKKLL